MFVFSFVLFNCFVFNVCVLLVDCLIYKMIFGESVISLWFLVFYIGLHFGRCMLWIRCLNHNHNVIVSCFFCIWSWYFAVSYFSFFIFIMEFLPNKIYKDVTFLGFLEDTGFGSFLDLEYLRIHCVCRWVWTCVWLSLRLDILSMFKCFDL